jgi:hypothetical protein
LALNTRPSLHPKWFTHNRGVARGANLTSIVIYSASSEPQTYDAITNTWTGSATPIWQGRARVQVTGSSISTNIADSTYNPTTVQHIQFQIPFGANELAPGAGIADIRPNDIVRVIASPIDDNMTKFVYIVTNVLNSSNPWERTIICRVDTELDPTVV